MKRKLVRYPLALLCLVLGVYCLLRGPGAAWTVNAPHTTVLGFTPDGASVWAYHRDESKEKAVIAFQRYDAATGKVQAQHPVDLKIAEQGQIVVMSDDSHWACVHVSQDRRQAQFNTQDLLVDLSNGSVRELPALGGGKRYSFSPTGRWLMSQQNGYQLTIMDPKSLQPVFKVEPELDAERKEIVPYYSVFSPDEKWLAVPMNRRGEDVLTFIGSIRIYDTATWKDQARMALPQPGSCDVVGWQGNKVLYYLYQQATTTNTTSTFDFFCDEVGASTPRLVLAGYSRALRQPNYRREYRLTLIHGADWHAVKDFRESYYHEWIESLRKRPIVSMVVDKFWPREVEALEFCQSSTLQLINRFEVAPHAMYRVSPDGKWIAGVLFNQDQFELYSTGALVRWPGYLLVLSGVVVLVWGRTLVPLKQTHKARH